MSRIGIIAALPAEANCLYHKKLKLQTPVEITKDIYLCLSGMGYDSAQQATTQLLKLEVDALISWGVAGSIDQSLKSGDLLIVQSIITNDASYSIREDWLTRLKTQLHFTKIGDIASVTDICATVIDKNNLSAKSGAIAVDMESAAIAELATANKIDFLVLRAIADDANTSIPEVVVNHTDGLGRPQTIPFIISCLEKPGQIKQLLTLAKCYKQALKTLKRIAPDLKKQQFLYNTQELSDSHQA